MTPSQAKVRASALLAAAETTQRQAGAAFLAMRSSSGLSYGVNAAKYVSTKFEADKLSKRAGAFTAVSELMQQAEVASLSGRGDEARAKLIVAAAMLSVSASVKRMTLSMPGFVRASVGVAPPGPLPTVFPPPPTQTVPPPMTLFRPAQPVATAPPPTTLFAPVPTVPPPAKLFGYGSIGITFGGEDGGSPEATGVTNANTMDEKAVEELTPPTDETEGDPNLTAGNDGINLKSSAAAIEDAGRGIAAVRRQVSEFEKIKSGGVLGAISSIATVGGVAAGAGAGVATLLVSAGVLSAVTPAGTAIAAAIVIGVGIYLLVDHLSTPDAPTIQQTGRVPVWMTGGDPRVANLLLSQTMDRRSAKQWGVDGILSQVRGAQQAMQNAGAAAGGLKPAPVPWALPSPVVAPGGGAVLPILAAAGAGFVVGGPPGAVGGALVGWLFGRK